MLALAITDRPRMLADARTVVSSWSKVAEQPIGERVRAAQAGDRVALQRVLELLAPHVLRTCRRILAIDAVAEEAAQETLMVLVRDLAGLREPAAAVAFAVRAASRVALRIRGKHDRQRDAIAQLGALPSAEAPSPAAELARRRLAERLLDVLAALPEAQAEALVLRYVAGLEPAEIAAASGVPVNTVRSRVRLAREALAERLAGDPVLELVEVHP
jgi:RNA polymerase sigma-70 factor, ECF subfamily